MEGRNGRDGRLANRGHYACQPAGRVPPGGDPTDRTRPPPRGCPGRRPDRQSIRPRTDRLRAVRARPAGRRHRRARARGNRHARRDGSAPGFAARRRLAGHSSPDRTSDPGDAIPRRDRVPLLRYGRRPRGGLPAGRSRWRLRAPARCRRRACGDSGQPDAAVSRVDPDGGPVECPRGSARVHVRRHSGGLPGGDRPTGPDRRGLRQGRQCRERPDPSVLAAL